MARGELPDWTPERCTHVTRDKQRVDRWEDGRPAYVDRTVRCINDAHPDFTFDRGQTLLCREHGEMRMAREESEEN